MARINLKKIGYSLISVRVPLNTLPTRGKISINIINNNNTNKNNQNNKDQSVKLPCFAKKELKITTIIAIMITINILVMKIVIKVMIEAMFYSFKLFRN